MIKSYSKRRSKKFHILRKWINYVKERGYTVAIYKTRVKKRSIALIIREATDEVYIDAFNYWVKLNSNFFWKALDCHFGSVQLSIDKHTKAYSYKKYRTINHGTNSPYVEDI